MATLTITTTGPLAATVEIGGTTVREPVVRDLGYIGDDLVSIELGGAETSAVLIGRADTLAALLRAALDELDPLL